MPNLPQRRPVVRGEILNSLAMAASVAYHYEVESDELAEEMRGLPADEIERIRTFVVALAEQLEPRAEIRTLSGEPRHPMDPSSVSNAAALGYHFRHVRITGTDQLDRIPCSCSVGFDHY